MIVSVAQCSGCGHREDIPQPDGIQIRVAAEPLTWPILQDAPTGRRAFCSRACLIRTAQADIAPHPLAYPRGLTNRDIALVELVAQGYTNKEIARIQIAAESTVKNQLTQTMDKLGVNTRIEAVLVAHALGVINLNVTASQCAERNRKVMAA